MNRRIDIVGGGLAGLALGIGLRQRGTPVTLWEAASFPRHRVCGEFISGQGQNTLDTLGLMDLLRNAGARPAVDTLFSSGATATPTVRLPQPALCLSRFVMDHALAQEFVRLGGDLRSHSRWKGSLHDEGVVSAIGGNAAGSGGQTRYLGLKVHARNVTLSADLEMHLVPTGYVGLCRLPQGTVNVCGLFRLDQKIPNLAHRWRDWLRGPKGSILESRLVEATFQEDSFCATSGFSLEPRAAADCEEIRIGDALTMIPPLTGNGMSMAYESAELALEPTVAYSLGRLTWDETRQRIATALDGRFRKRLRWASRLHQSVFLLPGWLAISVLRSERLWRRTFDLTR